MIFLISIFLPFVLFFGEIEGVHHHYFALEGDCLYWKREKSRGQTLTKAAGGPLTIKPILEPSECAKEVGKSLMNSRNLVDEMGFNPGARISAKLFYSPQSTWVLSYTGFFHWEGVDKIHCPENLDLPGMIGRNLVDYHYADRVEAIYFSDFYTVDLTYWRHVTPRYIDHFSVSWMIGLRFIDIDERFKLYYDHSIRFIRIRDFTFYFRGSTTTSSYDIKTLDRAFGPFFGGDIECNAYSFLTWGVAGNIGALFNRGEQTTLLRDEDNTVIIRDFSASSSNFGYFCYIYPFIEFHFVKFFTFRIGYDMLYIGRVVLADHQFFLNQHGGNRLDHDGNIVYHGLFAGIQFNF